MGVMATKRPVYEIGYEIIGGKKYMAPSAVPNHGLTISGLLYIFRNMLGEENFSYLSDVDVILDAEHTVRPDFMIISDFSQIGEKNIQGAPDFIAEVVSPSNAGHDFVRKKKLYELHGVKEYWIVDIYTRNIHVHVLENGVYADAVYHCYSQEELDNINAFNEIIVGDENEILKEQIKITHISSRTFGADINVPIKDIFKNII